VDRLERLVNLVVALMDTRRPLTREELRQRVGGYSEDEDNFHRNFERDKDILRQMGIPLVAEPLDSLAPAAGTGYRIPRDLYELPDLGLDEDELMALSLAASAVALAGTGQAATTALWKLAGASGARTERAREVGGAAPLSTGAATGAGAGDSGVGVVRGAPRAPGAPAQVTVRAPVQGALADVSVDQAVATLFLAVAERRVVRFVYKGIARQVDPYRLSYRQGRWYLAGFDHGRDAERLFRADRIAGPVEAEDPAGAFERPGGTAAGPPPPWRLGDDEEVVVRLRVDAGQAQWVRALAGDSTVVGTSRDGGTDFELRVTNREAFRGFVLGMLEHAEVMGPPEVRDEMIFWLEHLAGNPQQPQRGGGPPSLPGPRSRHGSGHLLCAAPRSGPRWPEGGPVP
jgi:predicted DNA-binding transcriptional regulator YafY